MSTSDRVCPEHGDIGATPEVNFCYKCGKHLEMKGVLRSAAEALPGAVVIGAGVGIGLNIADAASDAVSDLTDGLF